MVTGAHLLVHTPVYLLRAMYMYMSTLYTAIHVMHLHRTNATSSHTAAP